MAWQQFVMHLGTLPASEVERIFARHGAEAVTFSDAGDAPVLEPAPGETPLWPDTNITGLFADGTDFTRLEDDLQQAFRLTELPPHRIERLGDRVWEREWLQHFRPLRFGRRLWVCPGNFTIKDEGAVVVQLDPGLAFGTGTHATTALALEWLDSLDLRGKRVLDFGCGAGVLSIAALLLGARTATACDLDPQAITATRDNAVRNEVDNRLTATLDAGIPDGSFEIVVANILAGILIQNAALLCGHLAAGGRLLLCGILEGQVEEVVSAYGERLEFEQPTVRAPWVRLTGQKT
jgi:ribosomal protein L11 methyltransferase